MDREPVQPYSEEVIRVIDEVAEQSGVWNDLLESAGDEAREPHLLDALIDFFTQCANEINDLALWRGMLNFLRQACSYCNAEEDSDKKRLFLGIQETLTGFFPHVRYEDAGLVVLLVQILYTATEEKAVISEDFADRCQGKLGAAVNGFFKNHNGAELVDQAHIIAREICQSNRETKEMLEEALQDLKRIDISAPQCR